jgi:hypothetical protein
MFLALMFYAAFNDSLKLLITQYQHSTKIQNQ